jgi:hypothetical protein
MVLSQEQLDILNHVVEDGQAWADHAEGHFGAEKGQECMLSKVARYKASHDSSRASEGGNYKNRAVRESEVIDPTDQTKWTPMKRWKFAMAKQERIGGIDRDFEDLITDNPALALNEYTQTKYDDKVALRATRP